MPSFPVRRVSRGLSRAVCLLAATAMLSACSNGFRKTIGLEKTTPDEFQVVTRAPLAMPPDMALRPPAPGAPPSQQQDTRQRAQTAVFGPGSAPGSTGANARVAVVPGAGLSNGEAALLTQAGAGRTPGDIRALVDRETQALAAADRGLVDRLIFWQDPPPPGTVVDPSAEARRLRQNAASGRPLNQGDVPTIQRRRRAPLAGIF
ncbi:MAG TPA: DUF3035 domain-containing protein [Azospirillaceae bacterium]|nr:DUF3035 domain-containing protein [Azospirillaceae bacterium]